MKILRFATVTALMAAISAPVAFAGGHGGNPAVAARQAHMQLYQHNLSILGGMARGRVDYDADAAQAAANNLVALTQLSQAGYWLPGTTTDELGDATRLLPALFEEGGFARAMETGGNVAAAAQNLADVAGDGQAGLGPAVGALGQSCNSCHEAFQQARN